MTLEEARSLPRWTRVAAYAMCIDESNRMLLARVAPGYPAAGVWTLPGGGLDFGEHPEDAALRELTEETGLTGQLLGLGFVDSLTNGPLVEGGKAYGPWHGIRIAYRVQITGGELRPEVDESTDLAEWFNREDIAAIPHTELVDVALRFLDKNQ